ncbi:MAG: bifunctional phosphoribosyl-AMP cyclohydrolase/phosphoribosyl-ATP diphosphatase HisIE [Butyrivibrio sp.]|nr:bifunctional phosphoribosyl-AMP cyclohydrolase/phosphoribosyl-ATP diphosphatase HisIE [Butyrivibrio sp.]
MTEPAKRFYGTIYLKDKKALLCIGSDVTKAKDPVKYASALSDSGVDEIIVFDLSPASDDSAHEEALDLIKDICKAVDVPVVGAGNVKRMEDIKKLLYAGCKRAALNFTKDGNVEILKEVSEKFGKDKIVICYSDSSTINNNKEYAEKYASEMILFSNSEEGISKPEAELYFTVLLDEDSFDGLPDEILKKHSNVDGVAGNIVPCDSTAIDGCRQRCAAFGYRVNSLEPAFTWDELKKNSEGMIPVIVQDYRTDQVLMLAYMNEEAYNKTLQTGKMTYFSRSRQSLWLKGETSSHFQYVKSLTADCDLDTILAKVKQVGAACHTGSYSCFFNEIAKKDYDEKNPQRVLDSVYEVIKDRKEHPREGSYTNYLYSKGIDKILKKVGEEATEMVIAAKNPGDNEVIYEMSDFLYHMMVLMAVKNVSWEDITDELSRR